MITKNNTLKNDDCLTKNIRDITYEINTFDYLEPTGYSETLECHISSLYNIYHLD